MKFLCETIRGLIGVSSSILQDIIVLEAAVISGPYSNGGDDTATYATTSTTAGKNPPQVSQRMIELIGDISNLSMKMNIFSKDHEKKARETAKYIKMMKDVIMKQQEEVERLDNQIPIKKSVGTDMEDLVKAEEKLREEDLKQQKLLQSQMRMTLSKLESSLTKTLSENKKLKAALSKSTMLLKAQEALLEEYDYGEKNRTSHRSNSQLEHLHPRGSKYSASSSTLNVFGDHNPLLTANRHMHQLKPTGYDTSKVNQLDSLQSRQYEISEGGKRINVAGDFSQRGQSIWELKDPCLKPQQDIKTGRGSNLNPPSSSSRYRYTDMETPSVEVDCSVDSCIASSMEFSAASLSQSACSHEKNVTIRPHSTIDRPNDSFRSRHDSDPGEYVGIISPKTITAGAFDPPNNSITEVDTDISQVSPILNGSRESLLQSHDHSGVRSVDFSWAEPSAVGDSFMLVKDYYDSYFSRQDFSVSFERDDTEEEIDKFEKKPSNLK